MPKKGKGRGRGRGRGRDQNKPGEPISPGKGEEIGRRNDDGGHHHELHVPAAAVASTATTKLEATTKEDQGVCDTQSQLEQMVISDKNVTLPTESTASVSVAKSTAENLKQATVDQSAAAQAPSQQTRNQAVNNQSVSLGSTTSATRSINGSGKSSDYLYYQGRREGSFAGGGGCNGLNLPTKGVVIWVWSLELVMSMGSVFIYWFSQALIHRISSLHKTAQNEVFWSKGCSKRVWQLVLQSH